MTDKRDSLAEMVAVQCSDGNWNYDPYMHGMANGMIYALALIDDVEPEFLEAPGEWLADRPTIDLPAEPCT